MASDTAKAEAVVVLDEAVSRPPSGVVLPPKDIRLIVEKTAGFVVRNGLDFEDRVRMREATNPKFSFLNPTDAYNSFYMWRCDEVRAGRLTSIAAGRVGEQRLEAEAKAKAGPEQPPACEFSAKMPNISALDLDVVKLTAQFAAKNGRAFVAALAEKQASNAQFEFLRPNHSIHGYYTRLVDQYASIINGGIQQDGQLERHRIAQVETLAKNKHLLLDMARKRAVWTKHEARQRDQAAADKAAYDKVFNLIDWHDFVIVETVFFTGADETADLPPPQSLVALQNASLEQKASMSNLRIEEAMPTSDDFFAQPPPPPPPDAADSARSEIQSQSLAYSHPLPLPVHPQPQPQVQAPLPQQPYPSQPLAPPQPPLAAYSRPMPLPRRNNTSTIPTAICPNCAQAVPLADMEQHLKIELLDPKAREQRVKAAQRAATSNLATQQVAENLKRLASQRADVFDTFSGLPQTQDELTRLKKARS